MTEEPVVVAEVASPATKAAATVVVEKRQPALEAAEGKSMKRKTKRNTKISSLHPPYFEMIKDAITSLKDRTGSSQYAIAKFVEHKQKNLPEKFKKVLLIQLKRLVAQGKLVKVKASYKLPPKKKPTAKPKPATKKPQVKKPTTKPKPAPTAKAVAKPKQTAKPKPVDKEKRKTPTKPAKVARTSTPRKKPAPAKKPFRVTNRSTLRKVSSGIAKPPTKKIVKTKAATPTKSAATRKTKK